MYVAHTKHNRRGKTRATYWGGGVLRRRELYVAPNCSRNEGNRKEKTLSKNCTKTRQRSGRGRKEASKGPARGRTDIRQRSQRGQQEVAQISGRGRKEARQRTQSCQVEVAKRPGRGHQAARWGSQRGQAEGAKLPGRGRREATRTWSHEVSRRAVSLPSGINS